jgi:subtilisin family serine protease
LVTVIHTGAVEELARQGLDIAASLPEIVIGNIAAGDLEKLEQLEQVVHISTDPPARPHLNTSVPEIHGDLIRNGSPPYTGAGVTIGIIDTGIDIFHHNFRKPDGSSRILSIWDQTLPSTTASPPPYGGLGTLFTPAHIANALAHPDQSFAHKDKVGHGTHVAGIAAGNASQSGNCHKAGRYWGVAPEADLIVVKVVSDLIGSASKANLGLAALYVFTAAKGAAVINMSLGLNTGPRDGTSPQELFLDTLLKTKPVGHSIVVSAGNDGALGTSSDIARGRYNAGFHSAKHIAGNGHTSVTVTVPPDFKLTNSIEIWYSAGGKLQIQIQGPDGPPSPAVNPSATNTPVVNTVDGAAVSIVSTVNNPVNNNKGQISVDIDPPTGASLDTGEWIVTLTETAGVAVDVNLWVNNYDQRTNPVLAFGDRVTASTLSNPASAKNVITVGAYGSEDETLWDDSSRGPSLATDGRQKPDICAPGIESTPGSGIMAPLANAGTSCCCDCCHDFYTGLQGTSMAAPHVTGVVALMLQKNANLKFDEIQATIQTFCRKPNGVTPLPNGDWGFGKIDAQLATANIPPGSAFTGDPAPPPPPMVPDDPEPEVPESSLPAAAPPLPVLPKPFPPLAQSFSPVALRIGRALQNVAARGKNNSSAQMAMWLISTHFDEVIRLINTNRKVAVKWHRMLGSEMLRRVLWNKDESAPALPVMLRNRPVTAGLNALFDVLRRFGSDSLRGDLDRYGPLLLALPGVDLSQLASAYLPETLLAPSRNA